MIEVNVIKTAAFSGGEKGWYDFYTGTFAVSPICGKIYFVLRERL
jgi:hypothetical protein